MKKSHKTLWKKITHVFILIFMVAALTLGIIFSIFKINGSLVYGADFTGGFEATVAVQKRDPNKKITNEQIAKGLEDKLSPFNDLPITVSFKGQERLTVTAGKEVYNNSETLFRSSIESNGGMFVLNLNAQSEYEDLYTNPEALKAIDDSGQRINASRLFSDELSVKSLAKDTGRAPYISLGLNKESTNGQYYWSKIVGALQQQQVDNYYFVTDFEVLINRIKELYTLKENDPDLIKSYWTNVIEIAQKYINDREIDIQIKETLRDLFSGTISWLVRGTGTGFRRTAEISLLDTKFTPAIDVDVNGRRIQGIETAEDLADILTIFRPNLERSLDYFMYQSDASSEDFQSEKYKENRVSYLNRNKVDLGSVQKTFKTVTNFFLNQIIIDKEKTQANDGVIVVKEELNKIDSTIKEHFIFNGRLYDNHASRITINDLTRTQMGFITVDIESGNSNSLEGGLYLPAASLTVGRKAVASIIQNALGINYKVESIIELPVLVNTNWLLIATIALLIIAVLLAIYLLFVYRLLGLFTLIIAVMSASLMFIFASIFGIAISAQFIMALFLIIGLVIDISLILFDSFATKLYQDKQAIKTAFKISNKETIILTIDALVVAIIPNLVMFWVADGELKNFATIATIGIFMVLIFGVLILRFACWSLSNLSWSQKNQWLLPINTNYDLKVSFKNQYLINKYRLYLERIEGKEKLSSKELLKIQTVNQKLAALNKTVEQQKLENLNKAKLKDQKEIDKLHNKQAKLKARKETFLAKNSKFNDAVKHPAVKYIDLKTKNIDNILSSETLINVSDKNKESAASTLKTWKTERRFNKFGLILAFIIITFSIIGAIIGVTIGPNWSSSFGQGQEFVVYGTRIHDTYRYTIGQNRPADLNPEISKEAQRIGQEYKKPMEEAQDALNSSVTQEERIVNQKLLYLLEAEQLTKLYDFAISNNLFRQIHRQASDINLKTWSINVVPDYSFIDDGTGINSPANELAITIKTNATDKFSRTNFRRLLVYLSDPFSFPWSEADESHRDENGGIVAYDIAPYTTTNLIKQILIVFGILLLALIIYMIIRFKWTYYVALALGLILTFAFTFAAVIVFRIPVTIELLSGFALLISFVALTMIFLLGKGKSLLNFDDKNVLNEKFEKEIQGSEKIHAQKKAFKDEVSVLKAELKATKKTLAALEKQIKNFEEVDENKVIDLKVKKIELQLDIKKLTKDNRQKFKEIKKSEKIKIKQVSQSNFFFKEVYMELIKFTARRILTIGLFYMLTALILLITLAPMFGMGIVVLIGIIIGFMVTLFIVIPVWIFLEQKRIRNVNGFKNYMKNIKVSHEEQIVAGIND